MDTSCVCVYSGSGAMGKVSKTVAAVVSVAIVLHCSQCLLSHVWVLSPPVPCPSLSCQNVEIGICVYFGHK